MVTRFVFILLLLASPTVAYSEPIASGSSVEVIPLQNALPEDLIPSIKPLLDEGDRVTSHNNNLVVRTTPQRLEQIKSLIAQLDIPLKQLLISVRTDEGGSHSDYGGSIQTTITKGDVTISNSGGKSKTISSPNNHTTVQVHKHYGTRGSDNSQQVRSLEGRPVYISDGRLVPLVSGGGYYGPGIEYHDIARGFYATARVHGEHVTLAISRHSDSQENDGIKTGQIDSTVRGRLGEWVLIGSINQSDTQQNRGLAKRYGTTSKNSSQTWIKVELD